jgi:serine/threonine protein kinase/tetratricopeptide (TPR) repeat protein
MENVSNVCEKCGVEIPADVRQGVCPACLLEAGLGLLENEDHDAADPTQVPRERHSARAAKMLADFGDYELLEEIGRGGQGVVYRAHQKSLNRTVALKVIGVGPWATEAHLKRFRREAEAAANLDHPFIVPIHEIGERDGCCYFSMNFVDGGQLDEVVRRTPMSIRQAVELIAKLARTVHYAHEHGILHRDIKPGNILLDTNGEPHLTDFGLARLVEAESTITRTLEVMGTPSYMAPEQAAGEHTKISKATDVYGLGAVLYQLLTGHPPFAGGTSYQTIRLLLDTEPRQPRLLNPKVDRDLSTICLKCLEKDLQRRYSSALALAEDLEHWLKHEPIRAKRSGFFTHGRKWVRRNPSTATLITLLIAIAGGLGVMVWNRESTGPGTKKSIAVLPFENLSKEAENAFFADGVQDEILTDLSKVADLKVIGRASVMQYKNEVARDLRKISQQLSVTHVVEGTVQRAGNRVRVTARLIDARTDRQLWGQAYDRDLADVFAIQTEIAENIVSQLKFAISPQEKTAIERQPTADLAAYDLYIRAKILIESALFSTPLEEGLSEAVRLLNQAIQRDPAFAQAYAQIARAHDFIYFAGLDHTPARLAMAEAAIQSLARLRPNSAEAHLALGQHLYWGYRDYDRAREQLKLAQKSLPNDPLLFELLGFMDRRQGRWAESTKNLERAIEFDPQNAAILNQLATSYLLLRRYADGEATLDRAITLAPKDSAMRALRADIELHWHADPRPLSSTIRAIIADDSREAANIALPWLRISLCERDFDGARRALAAMPIAGCYDETVPFPRAWCEGLVAQMRGDTVAARAAFTSARIEAAKLVADQPDYAEALCVLGMADAALDNKEEAIREGRRAVELLPVTKDAVIGALLVQYLALIYAWTGEKDLALEQLAIGARIPGFLSYGELRLHPRWDPVRGDPRFDKIVASRAPKGK